MKFLIFSMILFSSLSFANERECTFRKELVSSKDSAIVNKVSSFDIIDLGTPSDGEMALQDYAKSQVNKKNWDAITNGSYTDYGPPIGDIVQSGRLTNVSDPPSFSRGGIALLSDGSIVLCRIEDSYRPTPSSLTEESDRIRWRERLHIATINKYCAKPRTRVRDFMGGASSLIENGNIAKDLNSKQHGAPSWDAGHSHYLASRGSSVFLISGNLNETEACEAGFDRVIRFDGGAGFFRVDRKGSELTFLNGQGFAKSYIGMKWKFKRK